MPDEPLMVPDTHKVSNIFSRMKHCDYAVCDHIVDIISVECRGITVIIHLNHHASHHVVAVARII